MFLRFRHHWTTHLKAEVWSCFYRALPGGSVVKNLPASAGDIRDAGSIPGLGRSPRFKKWPSAPQYSSWKIPWTEEPGGLQSIGSQNSLTQLSNWAHSLASNIINSMGRLASHIVSSGYGLVPFPQHRNCCPTNKLNWYLTWKMSLYVKR